MWGQQQRQRPGGRPDNDQTERQKVKIPDVSSVMADLKKEEQKEKEALRRARTATTPKAPDSCWC